MAMDSTRAHSAASYTARAKLAEQYGIKNYTGSGPQNTQLMDILKTVAARAAVSAPPAPAAVTPRAGGGIKQELASIAAGNRAAADYFHGLEEYAQREGGAINRTGGFAAGLAADVFENNAKVYDPGSTGMERGVAFGLIALDVGTGGGKGQGAKAGNNYWSSYASFVAECKFGINYC